MLKNIADISMVIMLAGAAVFVLIYGAIGAWVLYHTAKEFIDTYSNSD